jgi:oligosaccharide reducing-end xylanase
VTRAFAGQAVAGGRNIGQVFVGETRWGDGGAYNYSQWADTILGLVTSKPDPQQMFDPASLIVRFDPGTTFSDPSYMTPAFYETWARASSVTPAHWELSAAAARDVLRAAVDARTGLAPNDCAFDGSRGGYTTDYEDDAWRVVRNWALDYAWWAADDRQVDMTAALHATYGAHHVPVLLLLLLPLHAALAAAL